MGILSLVSRLALKHYISPHTHRPKGPWGRCLLQPCSRQDTQPVFPSGFPRKAASLGAGVLHVWEDSSATSLSQVKGSWKREELCFSQGLGWPIAPPTKPHSPQRGCRALPKASTKDAPVLQDATPSTNQPKYYRELSTLRGVFFQGLLTHSATENQIFKATGLPPSLLLAFMRPPRNLVEL